MPKKTAIVVHHFASHWGNAAVCRQWHLANGWSDIGYHYVINNGFPDYTSYAQNKRKSAWDGKIEPGRQPDTSVGAHVKEGGMNTRSIGISLVGNFDVTVPTDAQMTSLVSLLVGMCQKHGIQTDQIYYHRDYAINQATGKPYKSCPGNKFISRAKLRQMVKVALQGNSEPVVNPRLVLNGKLIEGAILTGGHWQAKMSLLSAALGLPKPSKDSVVKVVDFLNRLGFTKRTNNNRIKERNRFDIRAERA
jgi:hypothetical protein